MAIGRILDRQNIFGGAARLIKAASADPVYLEHIISPTTKELVTTPTQFTSGWSDIGATDDGLTLTMSMESEELEVDQSRFSITEQVTKIGYLLETNLAENSLENLQLGWELGDITAIAAGTGNVAQRTMGLGAPTGLAERALAFVVEKPGNKLRAYVFYKVAKGAADSAHAYLKAGKTVVPVQFKARPDTAKSEEKSIGIVLDQS